MQGLISVAKNFKRDLNIRLLTRHYGLLGLSRINRTYECVNKIKIVETFSTTPNKAFDKNVPLSKEVIIYKDPL